MPFHDKEVKGECSMTVDCHIHCYPDLVKLYCQMTSQQELAEACFFHKTQILDQGFCYMRKMTKACFWFEDATIQLSQWVNTVFAIKPQF